MLDILQEHHHLTSMTTNLTLLEQLSLVGFAVIMLIAVASAFVISGSKADRQRRIGIGVISCCVVLFGLEGYKILLSANVARNRVSLFRSLKGQWILSISDSSLGGNLLNIEGDGTATIGDTKATWVVSGSGKELRVTETTGDGISRQQKAAGSPATGQAVFIVESPTLLRWSVGNKREVLARKVSKHTSAP